MDKTTKAGPGERPKSKMTTGSRSAKSRAPSGGGRKSPTKSLPGAPSGAQASAPEKSPAKRPPLPQGGGALSRGRSTLTATPEKTPSEKSAARSNTSGAPSGKPAKPPRLSIHAMTLALSMTRRVKAQVLRKRQERANLQMEPTYRLEPKPNEKFNSQAVEKLLSETLERFLKDKKYDKKSGPKQALLLSNALNMRMKDLKMPRYKLVCHVIIGEGDNADVGSVSRCLWDSSTDSFATASFSNGSIYAVATAYGVYFE